MEKDDVHMTGLILFSLLAVLCSSCYRDQSREELLPDGGGDSGDLPEADSGSSVQIDPYEELEDFFGFEKIHSIEIELSDKSFDALLIEPKEYVEGVVRIDDEIHENAGVRLKGSVGSFTPLDAEEPYGWGAPGKSAFIVKFNEFIRGRKHRGLTKLTINNMVQDPTRINEFVGYTLFRELSIPACRTGYATVYLNGEYKGFYALIESTDNNEFLEHWFATADGNLYEGDNGSDVDLYSYENFDQDNGEDKSKSDLRVLAQVLDGIEGKKEVIKDLSAVLDLDTCLKYIAAEIFLGHWDGYSWSRNNFAIHHNPLDDKWTLMPWGLDQLFNTDSLLMGDYNMVIKPAAEVESYGRIHRVCMKSDDCSALMRDALETVMQKADEIDILALSKNAWQAIDEEAVFEAASSVEFPFSVGPPEWNYEFIQGRRKQIEEWIDCFDIGSIDHDNDGFNGCFEDCNDWNDAVKPMAPETCNFTDDDCNGLVDDAQGCPECMYSSGPYGENEYALCFNPRTWEDARNFCMDEGGDLISIHDELTRDYIFVIFSEELGIMHFWIGLNDLDNDGVYEWSDGTPVDFESWFSIIDGEGDMESCISQYLPIWFDYPCEGGLPFVCRIP